MKATGSLLIGGDCGPVHGPAQGYAIEGYTELVRPYFEQADARFVNCMRAYSTRGVANADAPQVCQPLEMAGIFTGGLFETALFYVGQHMSNSQLSGEAPVPMSTARSAKGGRTAIYDLFKCKGGKQVFIGIMSDPQWPRACAALGLDDLAADPALKLNGGRGAQRDMLMARIGKAVADREAEDVVDALVQAGVTVAPLNTPVTVLEDRHVKSEGRMLPAEIGGKAGRLPPLPFESSNYKFELRQHAPADTGRDTGEILRELGYSADEVDELARKGLVRGPGLAGAV